MVSSWDKVFNAIKRNTPISTHKADKRIWIGGKRRFYTVKEGYDSLVKQLSHSPSLNILGKMWKKDGLPKVNTLCWELVHGEILTSKNLKKRQI